MFSHIHCSEEKYFFFFLSQICCKPPWFHHSEQGTFKAGCNCSGIAEEFGLAVACRSLDYYSSLKSETFYTRATPNYRSCIKFVIPCRWFLMAPVMWYGDFSHGFGNILLASWPSSHIWTTGALTLLQEVADHAPAPQISAVLCTSLLLSGTNWEVIFPLRENFLQLKNKPLLKNGFVKNCSGFC